ncbi:uncharacterized protein LAJ45_05915 [Morchella importuna]|uniref:uncharacterized protein n=1 Tax=Morchella importuna TaxID=1174673 RepID=UPI001E8CFB57|nr:uncharacterized protein LAJ45_05915 [Morchella importuna]KAH8150229.1 hypothetical protein LAJ45_05915 [Morchella importuna]
MSYCLLSNLESKLPSRVLLIWSASHIFKLDLYTSTVLIHGGTTYLSQESPYYLILSLPHQGSTGAEISLRSSRWRHVVVENCRFTDFAVLGSQS